MRNVYLVKMVAGRQSLSPKIAEKFDAETATALFGTLDAALSFVMRFDYYVPEKPIKSGSYHEETGIDERPEGGPRGAWIVTKKGLHDRFGDGYNFENVFLVEVAIFRSPVTE